MRLTPTTGPKMTRGQHRAVRRAALTEIRVVQHAPTIEGVERVARMLESADYLVRMRAAMAILCWATDE